MNYLNKEIVVIGLGYVGLPLAVKLAAHFKVIGYDVSIDRIKELKDCNDSTKEIKKNILRKAKNLIFTCDKSMISNKCIYIITVPTPVKKNKLPDLSLLKNACKLAAADEFIDKLPNKYKTLIGENAIRLSGGQKQRISIARAILKNSPIILLDEATSSLDADSEEKVQNAIFNLTKNRTTLVIAHRLSTINKADKIILMKDGNVLKHGTHNELLKISKEYESLYKKQMMH